jgi:hypothetical protein
MEMNRLFKKYHAVCFRLIFVVTTKGMPEKQNPVYVFCENELVCMQKFKVTDKKSRKYWAINFLKVMGKLEIESG